MLLQIKNLNKCQKTDELQLILLVRLLQFLKTAAESLMEDSFQLPNTIHAPKYWLFYYCTTFITTKQSNNQVLSGEQISHLAVPYHKVI